MRPAGRRLSMVAPVHISSVEITIVTVFTYFMSVVIFWPHVQSQIHGLGSVSEMRNGAC